MTAWQKSSDRSLALELVKDGIELGVDGDRKVVQSLGGRSTPAVEADTTDEDAMRQLAVHEFGRAVVGIGTDLESSMLSASVLLNLSGPSIGAKAVSQVHARILGQIGIHHIVRPEHDMGQRVAHLVRGSMLDYIEFDDRCAIVKTRPPHHLHGLPLGIRSSTSSGSATARSDR
jgi:trk system potassium uptake protein